LFQEEEDLKDLLDLYKSMGSVFKESKKLVQLVLTYPITSNEGERSFSLLKRILTWQRTTMTEERLCNLARMAMHPGRLAKLSTESIINMYIDSNPRRLKLQRILSGGNNCSFLFECFNIDLNLIFRLMYILM
jgi:hypothetical protein